MSDKKLIEIQEKFIGKLYKQLEAAYGRLAQITGADAVRVQDEIDDLLKKIETAEANLKQQETSTNNSNPNRNYLQIEEKLHYLDFTRPKKTFHKILDFANQHNAAPPFLLQESYLKAGNLYISAIRKYLDNLETQGELKYYRIILTDDRPVDEYGFLDGLAGYLGIKPIAELDKQPEYIKQIINKICKSVRGGTTIFIEFQAPNKILNPDQFLLWFIEHFWQKLLVCLPQISENYVNVKFITVLCFHKKLPRQCLSLSCYCNEKNPDRQKIIKIPLSNWQQSDIQHWLESSVGLTISRSQSLAENIYDTTGGIPNVVINWIKDNSSLFTREQ
jgi:hypothetical protein